MSQAQRAQQSNRTDDGKYTTKSHSEADVNLLTSGAPDDPVAQTPFDHVEARMGDGGYYYAHAQCDFNLAKYIPEGAVDDGDHEAYLAERSHVVKKVLGGRFSEARDIQMSDASPMIYEFVEPLGHDGAPDIQDTLNAVEQHQETVERIKEDLDAESYVGLGQFLTHELAQHDQELGYRKYRQIVAKTPYDSINIDDYGDGDYAEASLGFNLEDCIPDSSMLEGGAVDDKDDYLSERSHLIHELVSQRYQPAEINQLSHVSNYIFEFREPVKAEDGHPSTQDAVDALEQHRETAAALRADMAKTGPGSLRQEITEAFIEYDSDMRRQTQQRGQDRS